MALYEVILLVSLAVKADGAASKLAPQGGSHRDVVRGSVADPELGPEMIRLVGTTHLGAEGG